MYKIDGNTIIGTGYEQSSNTVFTGCNCCKKINCSHNWSIGDEFKRIPVGALLFSENILNYKIRLFDNKTIPAVTISMDYDKCNQSEHVVNLCMAQNDLRFQEKYGEASDYKSIKSELIEEKGMDFIESYHDDNNSVLTCIKVALDNMYNRFSCDDGILLFNGQQDYTLNDLLTKLKEHNIEMCSYFGIRDYIDFYTNSTITHIYIDNQSQCIIFNNGTVDYYFDKIQSDIVSMKLFDFVKNLNQSIEHNNDVKRFYEFVFASYNHEIIDSNILCDALKFYGLHNEEQINRFISRYELLIDFIKFIDKDLCIIL